MSGGIHNYWQFPGLLFSVLKNLSIQKRFLQKNINPILSLARSNNDGSLDENDFRKITHYYGLAVPAILGEAFCALKGSEMSLAERWAATAQGAMTGLFDDFHDKGQLDEKAIESKLKVDAIHLPRQANEKLFELFYSRALEFVPDQNLTRHALMKVYEAQVQSKLQKESISYRAIKEITFLKGGASLVFYRCAFLPFASEEETNFLQNIGGLMQLSNDIFDVYKDRESGIHTLLTETKSIQTTRELFSDLLTENYAQAYTLGYKRQNVKKFLGILSIGIFSRSFVCLDQLEKNEQYSGNSFNVMEYSRGQLICDMDTKKNMLGSAAYHFKTIVS
ncbi:MAG TPA: class 1 isoprenoid biosynthesis enzyme [Ferruginibacter sp.]|nr:class 1 isoprenoid biosynthesis enzyme [Ferruginibacter sp.]